MSLGIFHLLMYIQLGEGCCAINVGQENTVKSCVPFRMFRP